MALPILELLFLRLLFHFGLGLKIGWRHLVDFDLLFPAPTAFLLYVYALESSREKNPLRFRPWAFALHLGFLFLFCLINIFLKSGDPKFDILWTVALIFSIASALCVCVPARYYLMNSRRWVALPCLVVAFSLVIFNNWMEMIWRSLALATGRACEFVLKLSFQRVSLEITSDHKIYLVSPNFITMIKAGCSGLEGFLLLTAALFFLAFLAQLRFRATQWALVWITGLVMVFWLNVVRICLFHVLGVAVGNHEWGLRSVQMLFHTHAGWLFYVIGIGYYCAAILRWHQKFLFPEIPVPAYFGETVL